MNMQKWTIGALCATTLVCATLALTLNSNAQGDAQGNPPPLAGPRFPGGQGGPPGAPGQFPGQPGQPGQFRPGAGMMGGGGGTAMDSDNSFLYIVQGNMLFKVSKSDLRILGNVPLGGMPPQMAMPERPARSGGGAGAPPPPPEEEESK